jgi:uncharacterized protein (DUF924 family)
MTIDDEPAAAGVLAFWFEELRPEQWFAADPALDATIRARFLPLYEALAADRGRGWATTPLGCLTAVIVLDQFPRNIFRGTARAFATDEAALAIARDAIAQGFDAGLPRSRRAFLYMPFQHAENAEDQARSVALFATLGNAQAFDYAERHRDVIARFGRFPHRNAALGRASTVDEQAYLAGPGAGF